jgi:hypothetical protein
MQANKHRHVRPAPAPPANAFVFFIMIDISIRQAFAPGSLQEDSSDTVGNGTDLSPAAGSPD